MNRVETDFSLALLDPAMAAPASLVDPQGRPAGRRFDVYRNNVVVSLKEAMTSAFPAVSSVVGEAFFNAMSGVFLRDHPPGSPVLSQYGTEFPAFLEGFEPVAKLPYLPDLARLEIALRQSYHAADGQPVDPASVAALASCDPGATRLVLAPSVRLVRSDWPVADIHAHALAGTPVPPQPIGNNALILRKDYDPQAFALSETDSTFIEQIMSAKSLAAALDAAPEVDFGRLLTLLMQNDALIDIETE